ncbi:hypothetical protein VISI1226_20989 [Vibrio sinaloensis DSM 21326]|uniref:Uncharacterized protein n=1 Tax=Vibrio sinaloensis DSM 21326 TaxID=945550 RepID=E8MAS5_PHOS4|nr:DUF692 domain-containing protein [Vibrio sinaloensis]EGA68920.1 hypothetical protein VISI1226_20989 [Vibrio sinaloensis DSM 21326]
MRSINNTAKGLGLRTEHIDLLAHVDKHPDIDFLELAPENWMNIGGLKRELLQEISSKYPLVAHGLSLSIGDTQPLNTQFVKQVRHFLDEFNIEIYSDHLSQSRDSQGYLYDLIPIPRRKGNIGYLSDRIKQVQDIISRPLVLENISYYHDFGDEMPEGDFMAEIVETTQCELLLDINNAYVNSQNHQFNVYDMINALPSSAIRYYHIAGHLVESDHYLIDTHGEEVCREVLQLAQYTFGVHGAKPLLLERDNNVPPLLALAEELNHVHRNVLTIDTLTKATNLEVSHA